MLVLSNNAGSTLVVAIADTDVEVQVQAADAAEFPSLEYPGDVFPARIRDNAGNYEYVLATAIDGNRVTIVRGREGTAARAFPAGASFEQVVTAEAWERLAESRWVRPMTAARALLLPTRIDAATFTIPGDVTAMFTPNRALRLIQTANAYGYVAASNFAGGATTVTVQGCVVDAGLALVELGQEIESAPKYGNAANADTLGGSTKGQVIAEALGGTAANANHLGGKTEAEVIAEALAGKAASAADSDRLAGKTKAEIVAEAVGSVPAPQIQVPNVWGAYKAGTYIFTVPDGVTSIRVWLAGAGGGAGRTYTGNAGGTRGGGGGGCVKTLTVTPGARYVIVLGVGGLRNTAMPGGGSSGYAGSPSTFALEGNAAMLTANGGSSATGGTATGGDDNMTGGTPYLYTPNLGYGANYVQMGGKSGLGDAQHFDPSYSGYQPKDIRGVGGGGAAGSGGWHYLQGADGADGYCEIYW